MENNYFLLPSLFFLDLAFFFIFPIVLLFGAESIYIEINIFKNKTIEYGN